MNILITGASGLIGTALSSFFSSQGHNVFALSRKPKSSSSFYWSPQRGEIYFDESTPLDVVIHLAGENIAAGRWTKSRKQEILQSREKGTLLLAKYLADLKRKPHLFISGSAIGAYGNSGDKIVDESADFGNDFLSIVCQKWENAAKPAIEAGIRTVNIRTGVVLTTRGGVLKRMLPFFKFGLGGKIGNGNQYMSWVSMADLMNMILFIIENDSVTGPVNLVSENPVTNKEFTKVLGKILKRPTIAPLPAFAAKLFFGELADALLLSSTRALPKKLIEANYHFIHNDLEKALTETLAQKL